MTSSRPDRAGRDQLLDVAKGLAIILVVVGHTLQGLTPQFDELPAFRFIYAFHMPLFAFLAGAASFHWLGRLGQGAWRDRVRGSAARIGRSGLHLLLPFAAWTLIGWWQGPQDVDLTAHLARVLRQPDVSLWFLPCIFWCTVYVSLLVLVVGPLTAWLQARGPRWVRGPHAGIWLPCACYLLLWLGFRGRLPGAYGFVFANAFHGGLFLYFVLGNALFRSFTQAPREWVRIAPYVVFGLLAPYWDRTAPANLLPAVPAWLHSRGVESVYALVVALAGTLAAVDVARRLASIPLGWLHLVMAYLGKASLAIYAVHFYFLGYRPAVAAPLALSVLFFAVLSRVPIVRLVLFGLTHGPQPEGVVRADPRPAA